MGAKPDRIVIATSNQDKLREIRRLLDGHGIVVVAQPELGIASVEETGETFAENALIKARHAVSMTGLAAIADDSGLVVDALEGRPGVRSARYAGPAASDDANIEKLLEELKDIDERQAAFRCAACFLASKDAEPLIVTAEWSGEILRARRGSSGFGYDPVFFDPELGRSAAELSQDEKNGRSHRGKALARLIAELESQ